MKGTDGKQSPDTLEISQSVLRAQVGLSTMNLSCLAAKRRKISVSVLARENGGQFQQKAEDEKVQDAD